MMTRKTSDVSQPQTRSKTRVRGRVPHDMTPRSRVCKQRHVDASYHNDDLMICQDEVLAPVIEFLRKQSGSLLAQRAGNSNCILISCVCRDWRRVNRACAADWLTGSAKPFTFEWQVPRFSHCEQPGTRERARPLPTRTVGPRVSSLSDTPR